MMHIQDFLDDMAKLAERTGLPDTLREVVLWLAERIDEVRGAGCQDPRGDEHDAYINQLIDKWEPYLGISSSEGEEFIVVEGLDDDPIEVDSMLDVCAPDPDEELSMDQILSDMKQAQAAVLAQTCREVMLTPEDLGPPPGSVALHKSNQPFPFFHTPEEAEREGFVVYKERDDDD